MNRSKFLWRVIRSGYGLEPVVNVLGHTGHELAITTQYCMCSRPNDLGANTFPYQLRVWDWDSKYCAVDWIQKHLHRSVNIMNCFLDCVHEIERPTNLNSSEHVTRWEANTIVSISYPWKKNVSSEIDSRVLGWLWKYARSKGLAILHRYWWSNFCLTPSELGDRDVWRWQCTETLVYIRIY